MSEGHTHEEKHGFKTMRHGIKIRSGRRYTVSVGQKDWRLSVRLLDGQLKPLGGITAQVAMPDGRTEKVEVGGDGKLVVERALPGTCTIEVSGFDPVYAPTTDHKERVIDLRLGTALQLVDGPQPGAFEPA